MRKTRRKVRWSKLRGPSSYKNLFRYYFFILFAYLHIIPSLLTPTTAPLGLTTIIKLDKSYNIFYY